MGLVIAVVILAVLTAAGVTVYIKVRRLSESILGTPDVTEGINRIRQSRLRIFTSWTVRLLMR